MKDKREAYLFSIIQRCTFIVQWCDSWFHIPRSLRIHCDFSHSTPTHGGCHIPHLPMEDQVFQHPPLIRRSMCESKKRVVIQICKVYMTALGLNQLFEMLEKRGGFRMTTNAGMQNLLQFPELFQNWQEAESFCQRNCPSEKRETFNLKEGRSTTCDGFRITNNSGML